MDRPADRSDPERRQVEAMAGYGIPEFDIAQVLDIDPRRLRELYAAELATGHIVANAKVAESLFRKATGDHRQAVTVAIFWLKTRAGWREAAGEERGAEPRQVRIEAMSDTELARRIAFLQRRLVEGNERAGAEPTGEASVRGRQPEPGP